MGLSGMKPLLVLAATGVLCFAAGREKPVAFVTFPNGAEVIRAGNHSQIALVTGDFLFAGDAISAHRPATVCYCPEDVPGAARSYSVQGSLTLALPPPGPGGTPLPVCPLPRLAREPAEVATLPSLDELLPTASSASDLAKAVGELPADGRAKIEPLLRRDLHDPLAALALGVALENAGLDRYAAEQYASVLRTLGEEPRLHQLIRDLVQREPTARSLVQPADPRATPDATRTGKTYALVIGISTYDSPKFQTLPFARTDAAQFAKYLATPRGGADEVKVLTDPEVTSGAIRNYFNYFTTKAKPEDTVVLMIASHGALEAGAPYVITPRADPQNPSINSFPLSEVQEWARGKKGPFRRTLAFLDLCYAGRLREVATPGGTSESREYLFLLATHEGKDAFAYESPALGQGHGVFTYFLLRGLNSDEARAPGRNVVTAGRLSRYVTDNVETVTGGAQLPNPMLGIKLDTVVADLDKQGIDFDKTPLNQLKAAVGVPKSARARKGEGPETPFPEKRSEPGVLGRRIALEDRGEQVLLRYLKGDEVQQPTEEFLDCERTFREALTLQPGAPYLEARRAFCEGRAAVFAGTFVKARAALEQSIRLEPAAAYAYNALGILWFGQNEFKRAAAAFEDAIARAPQWAYPRHNLGLVHLALGEYNVAEADYREAMRLAPSYFYLPYQLGLLYHWTNRLDEAREMYEKARDLAPGRAEPHNGLGAVAMLTGKRRAAEASFRTALDLPGQLPAAIEAARHNLGLVLAQKKETRAAALTLWEKNGNYLPSRISLADAAWDAARRQEWRDPALNAAAVEASTAVAKLAPGDVAPHRTLAQFHERQNDPARAIKEYQAVVDLAPGDLEALERLGKLHLDRGEWKHACAAFDAFLRGSPDSRSRRRVESARDQCASHIQ